MHDANNARMFQNPAAGISLHHGGLRVAGGVLLADVATHDVVQRDFPVLASVAADLARLTPAATLAGNVMQRPRCPYFLRGDACFKHGGDVCLAVDGHNRELAVLEGGPCFIVTPTDVGTLLVALDAEMELTTATGAHRTVNAGEFFVLPRDVLDRETVVQPGETMVAVVLPAAAAGGLQLFEKMPSVTDPDYALASLAAVRRADGEVRLVLGGVSPRPYRVYNSVEEETMSGGLDDETITGLAERALLDAEPLSENGYKVDLAAGLLERAIRRIASP